MNQARREAQETQEYTFSVQRGDPGLQTFRIAGTPGMTVLEALLVTYRNEDDSLGFRYSCTVGRCYSCLVLMNGRSVVACREPIVDGAILEPLLNRTVIRDLATDDSFARAAVVARPESGEFNQSSTTEGGSSSTPALPQ